MLNDRPTPSKIDVAMKNLRFGKSSMDIVIRPKCRRLRGFTLIELLVVISVIAILMGILMPALSAARKMAQGIVCTANLKQLSLAWTLYADENNSRLVGANVLNNAYVPYQWTHRVAQAGDPGYQAGMRGAKAEEMGIRTGALYPYVNETKPYHCVADPTWRANRDKASLGERTVFLQARRPPRVPTAVMPFRTVSAGDRVRIPRAPKAISAKWSPRNSPA